MAERTVHEIRVILEVEAASRDHALAKIATVLGGLRLAKMKWRLGEPLWEPDGDGLPNFLRESNDA